MKKVKFKFLKMNSIRTKMILNFSVLVLAATIAIGFTSLASADRALVHKTEDALISLSVESAKLTKSRIEAPMKVLETIASFEDIQSMNWSRQQPILLEQVERTGFLDIAVVDMNGTAHYSNGSTSELGDRVYIKKALNGETNVSDLLVSRVTNSVVLMYATPVKRDGKIVGALICRNDGNILSQITDDIGYGENGYGFMINKDGVIVAHPNRDYVIGQLKPTEEAGNNKDLESLADLVRRMLEVGKGFGEYSYNGKNLFVGFTPVDGTNWFFATTADKDEILADIPVLRNNITNISGIILFICIVVVFISGTLITKSIIQLVRQANIISSLDIRNDVPAKYLKKKDEIGDLARSLQEIAESLREIMRDVMSSSDQLSATSEELASVSQEAAATAEEVSKSTESIASGAATQAANVENGVSRATILSGIVDIDQKHINNLNQSTEKMVTAVREGLSDIENLSHITNESNAAIKDIYDIIIKTNDSSKKIGKASELIASIAKETNLLAINAAIEAARAGESGKTFVVVADRIRNLAEQSSLSTNEIKEIINELQFNAKDTVNTIERIVGITEEQTISVKVNKNKYLLISEALGDSEIATRQITESGQKIAAMANEILDSLQSLSAIAEENSAATEEVSAAMEQQSSAVEEVASSSEELAKLAQNLQMIVNRFKV